MAICQQPVVLWRQYVPPCQPILPYRQPLVLWRHYVPPCQPMVLCHLLMLPCRQPVALCNTIGLRQPKFPRPRPRTIALCLPMACKPPLKEVGAVTPSMKTLLCFATLLREISSTY